ncbi:RNA polymerase sigma factor SigZ [Chryseotalea sanaruensis]|uniref:RNA polymerase sigma factor SigZ n=1 Tax=Chryseotalea sanaruensis TaxID=2482724 RepID=A0A401U7V5_9BACT|nr:sigma-70 family RNA polymerase sigma factor [Chryseotalea sanaruensis]GCC50978.1 RNA polymerase sigma factor SigZ [Chryseotalea sanaruensis]
MNSLHHDLYQKIKRYVLSHVRDKQDAEDIVQDIFIKIQLQQHQVRNPEKLIGWMYRIAKNSIIDHYRLRKKEQTGMLVEVTDDRHIFNECVEQCLMELAKTLPSPYQEALELSEKQNISQTELAKRWNISYSGAKSRIQRARQMLKGKLQTLYRIETDAYGNILVCENREHCSCNAAHTLQEELNRII